MLRTYIVLFLLMSFLDSKLGNCTLSEQNQNANKPNLSEQISPIKQDKFEFFIDLITKTKSTINGEKFFEKDKFESNKCDVYFDLLKQTLENIQSGKIELTDMDGSVKARKLIEDELKSASDKINTLKKHAAEQNSQKNSESRNPFIYWMKACKIFIPVQEEKSYVKKNNADKNNAEIVNVENIIIDGTKDSFNTEFCKEVQVKHLEFLPRVLKNPFVMLDTAQVVNEFVRCYPDLWAKVQIQIRKNKFNDEEVKILDSLLDLANKLWSDNIPNEFLKKFKTFITDTKSQTISQDNPQKFIEEALSFLAEIKEFINKDDKVRGLLPSKKISDAINNLDAEKTKFDSAGAFIKKFEDFIANMDTAGCSECRSDFLSNISQIIEGGVNVVSVLQNLSFLEKLDPSAQVRLKQNIQNLCFVAKKGSDNDNSLKPVNFLKPVNDTKKFDAAKKFDADGIKAKFDQAVAKYGIEQDATIKTNYAAAETKYGFKRAIVQEEIVPHALSSNSYFDYSSTSTTSGDIERLNKVKRNSVRAKRRAQEEDNNDSRTASLAGANGNSTSPTPLPAETATEAASTTAAPVANGNNNNNTGSALHASPKQPASISSNGDEQIKELANKVNNLEKQLNEKKLNYKDAFSQSTNYKYWVQWVKDEFGDYYQVRGPSEVASLPPWLLYPYAPWSSGYAYTPYAPVSITKPTSVVVSHNKANVSSPVSSYQYDEPPMATRSLASDGTEYKEHSINKDVCSLMKLDTTVTTGIDSCQSQPTTVSLE
ncbi:MAG: hypothetical protein HY843_08245 [Bdellovibrio sp.]|nr:hypothetical protein [Bdellovibrio sp.]